MQIRISKWAQSAAVLALVASALPAAAAPSDTRHRAWRPKAHRVESSDVTVRKSAAREPVGYDAFHGPAAIITAPVYIAGTFVSLPFRALEVVFPPHANDPRVLIGAPVHFAGQVAQFPFSTVNNAFGGRPTYYNYN